MSDAQDRDHNEQKKKPRRTRKDEEGRNFTCPCGKSYLSYPALYTHTKTKHHGKAPKQNATLTKRQNQEQSQIGYDSLIQIKQTIQKFFPNDTQPSDKNNLADEVNLYIDEIYQNYEEIKDKRIEDNLNNRNQSINNIFAKFLLEIRSKIKNQAYLYLCQLFYLFAKNIGEEKKDKDYCINNNGVQLPHHFNSLIAKKKVPTLQQKQDPTINSLTLACKILYNFGIWLFDHKFTNFSIKYNVAS